MKNKIFYKERNLYNFLIEYASVNGVLYLNDRGIIKIAIPIYDLDINEKDVICIFL